MNKGIMKTAIFAVVMTAITASGLAQNADDKKQDKKALAGTPVLWEKVDVAAQDTFNGPGGEAMKPDLSNITFVEEVTGGYSKKYKIKDVSGRTWVAKIGD